MTDIVLDTNILAELLIQYFSNKNSVDSFQVEPINKINNVLADAINKIISWHQGYVDEEFPGFVISSTFGFVEISRKFVEISNSAYTVEQLASFIEQPPEWFLIASVDINLFNYLKLLPTFVQVSGGSGCSRSPIKHKIHAAFGSSNGLLDLTWMFLSSLCIRLTHWPYAQS
ncbi:hypothetical protein [Desulfogranum japonicum]|uniref:hypothetical protein n=1 Tax=Desulfogranum japonicum TaxID=231447 RepID=UPI0012947BE1|nr:hypothetical protein [Desulfogranum japonicum]